MAITQGEGLQFMKTLFSMHALCAIHDCPRQSIHNNKGEKNEKIKQDFGGFLYGAVLFVRIFLLVLGRLERRDV